MEINGENTIRVEGKDYWFINQFARLTDRKEGSIRVLVNKGNRIRRLKSISFGGKPLILATELFDFPFVTCGHPSKTMGDFVEKYYLEKGELLKSEEAIPRCQD